MHQLKQLLLELKLHGMEKAIDGICLQANENALLFSEAMLMLAQSEKQYRLLKKSDSLQKKAMFRNNSRLENWDNHFERGLSKQQLRELISLQFEKQRKNLLIMGQTGVGKTQLAIAIGRAACNESLSVAFMSTNHFFEEYTVAQSTGKTLNWIRQISKPNILILDDFALRRYSHTEATILLEVLEERFQKGVLIITSQIDPSGWHTLFEDPAVIDAILDRIQNPSIKLVLSGKSYRSQLGQDYKDQSGQEERKK